MSMVNENTPFACKIIVMGAGGCGKTSLTTRMVNDCFMDDYDPTLQDSHTTSVVLSDGSDAALDITDTAGQDEFMCMRDQWIRDGNAFLLVYDLTRRETLQEVVHAYTQIRSIHADAPVVVAGNKIDLASSIVLSGASDGSELARRWSATFFETSAKLNINVAVCFLTLAERVHATTINSKQGVVEVRSTIKCSDSCTLL